MRRHPACQAGANPILADSSKKAQEALQKHEDMTFSDAEIGAFLPKELKRGDGIEK
jgi:hypothetical protein